MRTSREQRLEARDYVPDAASKVRKTWYTRRDRDGRTVLVQVEEGVEDYYVEKQRAKPGAASDSFGRTLGCAAASSSAAPSCSESVEDAFLRQLNDPKHDPFHHVLHQHSYIHPHSSFMRLWESFVLLPACAYFILASPIRLAFPTVWPTPSAAVFDGVVSCLLLFDVFLRFLVAFEDAERWDPQAEAERRDASTIYTSSTSENVHLVVDPKRIRMHHLRFRFWVGLLGALPLDVFLVWALSEGWSVGGSVMGTPLSAQNVSDPSGLPGSMLLAPSASAYAGLMRLFCGVNLALYFTQWELSATIEHTIVDRIVKNVLVGAIGAHWLACGWIYIARSAEVSGYRSHLSAEKELAFYVVNGDGEGLQYMRALFWALVTMSGVGYGDITPISLGETLFSIFAVAFGTSFFLFTVGSVTSIIASSDAVNAQVKAKLVAIKTWMARASLPPEMRLRILDNFYEQNVTRKGAEDRLMISELPKFLQHEVAMFLNKDIVSSTALFRGCSPTLVASMVEHLHAHRCLPLDYVVHKGDVGEELYLIKQGLFEVLNEDDTVHRMLGAGSYFGEIALLCHVHRTMTVRAVTHALVFVIERANFAPLMAEYPADMNQLLLSAALRYRTKAKTGFVVGELKARQAADADAHGGGRGGASGGQRPREISHELLGQVRKLGTRMQSATSVEELSHVFTRPARSAVGVRKLGGRTQSTLPHFQQGVGRAVLEQAISSPEGSGKRKSSRISSGFATTGSAPVLSQACGAGAVSRFVSRIASVGGGRRSAADESDTVPKCSNPLAFASNKLGATPQALMETRNLKELQATPAERYSQLRDTQIVSKLVGTVTVACQSRVSIQVPDDAGGESERDGESFVSRDLSRRKSTYQSNIETLQQQLSEESCVDGAELDEESAYVPRYPQAPPAHAEGEEDEEEDEEEEEGTGRPEPANAAKQKPSGLTLGWFEA